LGKEHINDLSCGCAMTTLSPEVVRSNEKSHVIYQEKMTLIVGLVANGLHNVPDIERTSRSWSLLGILIGGLTMARAVNNKDVEQNVASSIIATAIALTV
jgi:hypothetical protein